jgi:hypothetical protein
MRAATLRRTTGDRASFTTTTTRNCEAKATSSVHPSTVEPASGCFSL